MSMLDQKVQGIMVIIGKEGWSPYYSEEHETKKLRNTKFNFRNVKKPKIKEENVKYFTDKKSEFAEE